MRTYLTTREVAELLRRSPRSIAELTRTNAIPHRKFRGTRPCLFIPDEIDAWADGAELEVVCDNGSKVVKVKGG